MFAQSDMHLSNFGVSLMMRFKHLGQVKDIEESVEMLGKAVSLTLDGHPDKPMHLNSLGISLLIRFKNFGEVKDIDKSIILVLLAL